MEEWEGVEGGAVGGKKRGRKSDKARITEFWQFAESQ